MASASLPMSQPQSLEPGSTPLAPGRPGSAAPGKSQTAALGRVPARCPIPRKPQPSLLPNEAAPPIRASALLSPRPLQPTISSLRAELSVPLVPTSQGLAWVTAGKGQGHFLGLLCGQGLSLSFVLGRTRSCAVCCLHRQPRVGTPRVGGG